MNWLELVWRHVITGVIVITVTSALRREILSAASASGTGINDRLEEGSNLVDPAAFGRHHLDVDESTTSAKNTSSRCDVTKDLHRSDKSTLSEERSSGRHHHLDRSELSASTSSCPDSYWDDTSKHCSRPLVSTLESLWLPSVDQLSITGAVNWTFNDQSAVNRTCVAWHQTSVCYQHLLRVCQSNHKAHRELRAHSHRFLLYGATCSASQFKRRRKMIECFLPHVKPTMTCTEAFDKYFRSYIAEKQYRNACRVVSTAMKCFHEIQREISDRCPDADDVSGTTAAAEFQLLYIRPLVDQSRDTVVSRCAMSQPYEQYFLSTAAPRCERRTNYFVASLVALSFAAWQHQGLRCR